MNIEYMNEDFGSEVNNDFDLIDLSDFEDYIDEDFDNDLYYVGDDETGRIYKGSKAALAASDALNKKGVKVVMYKVEDIKENLNELNVTDYKGKSVTESLDIFECPVCHRKFTEKELIDNQCPRCKETLIKGDVNGYEKLEELYEEPELLGKGYTAPTSRDFVKEVNFKLKYNAFEDLKNMQKYMNDTISDVEEFDDYWKSHKQAIMKNIKEAQDLIPAEYRM